MISLHDHLLINKGKNRACYVHPDDSRQIVKVPILTENNRENIKELKGYQALMREQVDLFCISHCYGFVTTNRGRGLVCDCVRDDSGAVSKTIWDIIVYQEDCDIGYITEVADDFCKFLLSRNMWIFDLNPKNIILKLRYDGTYQPFAIDLKGRYDNNEIIPFSSYFSYFARKKLKRRSRQLLERIALFRKRREEFRSFSQQEESIT